MNTSTVQAPIVRPVNQRTFAVDVGPELVLVVTAVEWGVLAVWCLAGIPLFEAEVGEA